MKLYKRLAAVLMAACLMFVMTVAVCAHEAVDQNRTGSVTVTMKYNENPVPGGTLTLYRAGEIREDDGNYSFVLTEEFAKSGVSLKLEDMDDSDLADMALSLASYAAEKGLLGKNVTIGSDGTATAKGLKLGLYLIVQSQAAPGYNTVSPFLISVPMKEGGAYVYEVDATPKMSTLTPDSPDDDDTPPDSDTPPNPDTPGPGTPAQPALPQTGQLNWPVPVMAALGLCLFLTGWLLRYGKKGAAL